MSFNLLQAKLVFVSLRDLTLVIVFKYLSGINLKSSQKADDGLRPGPQQRRALTAAFQVPPGTQQSPVPGRRRDSSARVVPSRHIPGVQKPRPRVFHFARLHAPPTPTHGVTQPTFFPLLQSANPTGLFFFYPHRRYFASENQSGFLPLQLLTQSELSRN